MQYIIEKMQPDDWVGMRAVYREGIGTGFSTFEASVPDWEKFDSNHLAHPRLVARAQDNVLGWACLSSVSNRAVYAGVAEVSLYVGARYRGQGIGSALLTALIDASEKAGIWTLQGIIFPENTASLALVRKHGFREVGHREKIARMTYGEFAGTWRDTILVERRSRIVGRE
jgi:phosphinothricin acetyltransferase